MARGDLSAAAAALLESVVEGLTPGTVLDREPFVTLGDPPEDCCRQVTVQVLGVAPLDTRTSGARERRLRTTGLVLSVTFKVLIGDCFTDYAQGAGADQIMADTIRVTDQAWGIYNHVMEELLEGVLFPGTCRGVGIQELVPEEVSGGCGGWSFTVTCEIDGS